MTHGYHLPPVINVRHYLSIWKNVLKCMITLLWPRSLTFSIRTVPTDTPESRQVRHWPPIGVDPNCGISVLSVASLQ
jgi:hypothetical protein